MLELIMYDGAGTRIRLDGGIAAVTPAHRYQDGVQLNVSVLCRFGLKTLILCRKRAQKIQRTSSVNVRLLSARSMRSSFGKACQTTMSIQTTRRLPKITPRHWKMKWMQLVRGSISIFWTARDCSTPFQKKTRGILKCE